MSEQQESARQSINNISLEYLKTKRRVAELECKISRYDKAQKKTVRNEKEVLFSNDQLKNEKNLFCMKEVSALGTAHGVGSTKSTLLRSQEVEMGLSLLGVSTEPPSRSYQNDTTIILDEILRRITTEIQTAGLRKRREAAILSLMDDLREEQERLHHIQLVTCEEWKSYAEECVLKAAAQISSLSQQLLLCNEMKEQTEKQVIVATEKCAQAATELEVVRYQCSSIREEAERAKNEAWEKCIENKTLLIADFKSQVDELKQKLQQETDYIKLNYTHDAKLERVKLEKKWEEKYKVLEIEFLDLRRDAAERHHEVDSLNLKLDNCQNERQKEKVMNDEALRHLREELKKESQSLQVERERSEKLCKENQLLQKRLERSKLDLKDIEEKVKKAFDFKDSEYRSAIMQLNIAKERESLLEKQMHELDLLT